jgi:4-amino-4-deoxychorismate lyase
MTARLLNGAALPLTDRGVAYGDGLFETLAVVRGRLRLLPLHLARLTRGLERLQITGLELAVVEATLCTLAATVLDSAALKLIVTRGEGQRGYTPPADPEPHWFVQQLPWTPPTDHTPPAAVRVSSVRLASQPLLAGLKHLNRLEQVLARLEHPAPAVDEVLLLNGQDQVVCAGSANVFCVRDGRLLTPAITDCGVEGVMRASILQACAAGHIALPAQVTTLTMADLLNADEVFLTSALRGAWPVSSIDAQPVRPGTVARQVAAYWRQQDGSSPVRVA